MQQELDWYGDDDEYAPLGVPGADARNAADAAARYIQHAARAPLPPVLPQFVIPTDAVMARHAKIDSRTSCNYSMKIAVPLTLRVGVPGNKRDKEFHFITCGETCSPGKSKCSACEDLLRMKKEYRESRQEPRSEPRGDNPRGRGGTRGRGATRGGRGRGARHEQAPLQVTREDLMAMVREMMPELVPQQEYHGVPAATMRPETGDEL